MTPLASMSPTLRDDDCGSIAGPLRIAGFLGDFRTERPQVESRVAEPHRVRMNAGSD